MFRTFILTGVLTGLTMTAATAKADVGFSLGIGGRRGGVGVSIGDYHRHDYYRPYPPRYYVAPVVVRPPVYVQPQYVPAQPVYVAPPAQPMYVAPVQQPTYVAPPAVPVAPPVSSTQQSYYLPARDMVRYRGAMLSGPTKLYAVRHPYTGASITFNVPAWREPRKVEWKKNELEMKYERGEIEVHFDRDGSAVVEYQF